MPSTTTLSTLQENANYDKKTIQTLGVLDTKTGGCGHNYKNRYVTANLCVVQ